MVGYRVGSCALFCFSVLYHTFLAVNQLPYCTRMIYHSLFVRSQVTVEIRLPADTVPIDRMGASQN